MKTYDIGDRVRLAAAFTTSAKVPTAPTSVALNIHKPDLTNIVVTSPSTDVYASYYYEFTIDQSGNWSYRWAGDGVLVAAGASEFYVRRRKD